MRFSSCSLGLNSAALAARFCARRLAFLVFLLTRLRVEDLALLRCQLACLQQKRSPLKGERSHIS